MTLRAPDLLRLASAARSDGDLLRDHAHGGPGAFDELARRHTDLARRAAAEVCPAEADDVAQATLALLARKAARIGNRESASGWVFETARRLALKARTAAARRAAHEGRAAALRTPADPLDALTLREVRAAVAEEVARLPDELRLPLVVCYWDGASRPEAAARLGCSLNTLKRRLDDGRDRLAARLASRGFAGSAVLAALATVEAGVAVAGLARPIQVTPWKLLSAAVVAAGVVAAGFGIGAAGLGTADPPGKTADRPPAATAGPAADQYGDPLPAGAVARLGSVRFRHGGGVQSLAYTADGKTLASGGSGKIVLWDAATGKPLGQVVPTDEIPAKPGQPAKSPVRLGHTFGLAFTPDGNWLVAGGGDRQGHILFWNAKKREMGPVTEIHDAGNHYVRSIVVSPDGKTTALGTGGGKVMIIDVKTQESRTIAAEQTGASGLAFSPDGKTLAVAIYERIQIFNPKTGIQMRRLEIERARNVAFAPDGKSLWVGCEGWSSDNDLHPGTVIRWDLATDKAVQTLGSLPGSLLSFAVSPDGKTVAAGGEAWGPDLWDAATGRSTSPGDPGPRLRRPWLQALTFSPDAKTLVSGDTNGRVRLWDVTTRKELHRRDDHTGIISKAALSPDGTRAATTGSDGTIRIWDSATGKAIRSWTADEKWGVIDVEYTPDGGALLTSGYDGSVRLWDPATGKEVRRFRDGSEGAKAALSPDGRLVAASGADGRSIVLYETATGRKVRDLAGHASSLLRLMFTRDGRRLVSLSAAPLGDPRRDHDRSVRVWDVATGTQVQKIDIGLAAGGMAVSPDGRIVAATTYLEEEKTFYLQFWDLETGAEIIDRRLKKLGAVAFTPDGRYLAAADRDIRLIEAVTGRVVQTFETGAGSVGGLTFARDGRRLISAHEDGTALVWDVTPKPMAGVGPDDLWADLGSDDAAFARRAGFALAADPKAIDLLATRLKPVPKPAGWRPTAALITDLDDPAFRVREAASKALIGRVGSDSEALTEARASSPSAEVRQRLGEVLKAAPGPWPTLTADDLRRVRAVGVLEMIGTPDARAMLRALADGDPSAPVTQSARAGLRLTAR